MKRKKKIKKTNILVFILFIIALITLIYCVYKIINWQSDNIKVKKIEDKITDLNITKEVKDSEKTNNVNPPEDKFDPYWDYIKMNLLEVDFEKLEKENPDTVGFINVPNTNINYPVVQGTNNSYYLTHDYSESYNDAGWIFMDYRNSNSSFDKNTIIYGHSRLDKSMFGTLRNATNKSWYNNKNNHVIRLSTKYENTLWQVFSVYTIKAEDYYIKTNFSDTNDYKTWINKMLDRSIHNFNTSVSENDKVLTLSSCYTTDGIRVVVQAKLIKEEKR